MSRKKRREEFMEELELLDDDYREPVSGSVDDVSMLFDSVFVTVPLEDGGMFRYEVI